MKSKALSKILAGIEIESQVNFSDQDVLQITHNSRVVFKGTLFVAISGFATDGHRFLAEAEKNGAVAAIVEKINPDIGITQIQVRNSRDVLPRAVVNFYQPELSRMKLVGITGTNGKTTTSFLIRSVMESAGLASGLIGTINYLIGKEVKQAWNTTPESTDLCRMFYEMYEAGQRGCVLEVSSHALSLKRVDYIDFAAAVFTNLTQDHLDFHQDMESYFAAKQILFERLSPEGRAIINAGDSYGRRLLKRFGSQAVSFSLKNDADVYPVSWQSTIDGLNIEFMTPAGELKISSPLIGEFNVENIAAAVATGIALDFDTNAIKKGIENLQRIPGRLELVPFKPDIAVVVDYSHTPDALDKALSVLRKITSGRLRVVFGCGGDRDKAKRPIMGKIAYESADQVIITSDNPRSEEPMRIITEIQAGIPDTEDVIIESDRRQAIYMALQKARPGDTILIAGKGHEDYQEIKGIKHPFDDRKIVREAEL